MFIYKHFAFSFQQKSKKKMSFQHGHLISVRAQNTQIILAKKLHIPI